MAGGLNETCLLSSLIEATRRRVVGFGLSVDRY